MTNEEITADIIAACEAVKAKGFRIAQGRWGTVNEEDRCACALSAVSLTHGPVEFDRDRIIGYTARLAARQRYSWTTSQINGFVGGFDGDPYNCELHSANAYNIGYAVREAVLK